MKAKAKKRAVQYRPEPTVDDVADICDRGAGNFYGVHKELLALLRRRVSEGVAREIMAEIAQAGGLQGM